MSKITRDKILLNPNSMVHWAFITAVSAVDVDQVLKDADWNNKKSFDISIDIDGVKVPFDSVMEELEKQLDEMIAKKAADIIADKFSNLSSVLRDLEDQVGEKVAETVGITYERVWS